MTDALADVLKEHIQRMPRRFHTPGHAGFSPGNILPHEIFNFDLSEVGDLDVLSEPAGNLKTAQQRAAKTYNVRDSFFLVNGASVGLMAAMLAALKPGDKVLVPRNAHRSIISGLILTGAEPVWLLPEAIPQWGIWGAVHPADVRARIILLDTIKAVVVTSPTYEGIGSDIESIATLCRQRNMLLIVDEAHGALWPFSDRLPTSAIKFDCDCVVQSLHKSGGSLTQSAIAHLPKNSRIDAHTYQQALNTLQSTSPSYLLLASLDATIGWLVSHPGQQRLDALLNHTEHLRRQLQSLSHFSIFDHPTNFDPTRLYLMSDHEAGTTPDNAGWGDRVEYNHGMPYESASPYGVLYLANIGLQTEDFDYFLTTLQTMDGVSGESRNALPPRHAYNFQLPQMGTTPRDAFFAPGVTVSKANAIDRIAKETLVHCPPGIPVLIPGERISPAHLPQLPETLMVLA